MQAINPKDLMNEIEYKKRRIAKDKAMWDKIIPEQIPTAYFGMGLESRGIAIYTLVLGNKEEALNWFEQAVEYYLNTIEKDIELKGLYRVNESSNYLNAFYMSVFSDNTDLIVKVAKRILGMPTNFPKEFPNVAINFYYAMSLGSLILDKSSHVSDFLRELVEVNKTKKSDFFEGASEFIKGMHTGNAHAVKEGINKVLEVHEKRITKGPLTDDELVCISGSVFLLMAKNKGIEIKPADIEEKYRKFIPWNLLIS